MSILKLHATTIAKKADEMCGRSSVSTPRSTRAYCPSPIIGARLNNPYDSPVIGEDYTSSECGTGPLTQYATHDWNSATTSPAAGCSPSDISPISHCVPPSPDTQVTNGLITSPVSLDQSLDEEDEQQQQQKRSQYQRSYQHEQLSTQPPHYQSTYLVEVHFQYRRAFFLSSSNHSIGTFVVVEADRGHDMGCVRSTTDDLSTHDGQKLQRVIREASTSEVEVLQTTVVNRGKACLAMVQNLGPNDLQGMDLSSMKFLGCEFQYDMEKCYLYYTSNRFDQFLPLAKFLHRSLKCRIWIHHVDRAQQHQQRPSSSSTRPAAYLRTPKGDYPLPRSKTAAETNAVPIEPSNRRRIPISQKSRAYESKE